MSILSNHITSIQRENQSFNKANTALRSMLGFVLMLCLLTIFTTSAGQDRATQEYQIKGAFLFNFAQFTDWPPKAFPDSQSPLVIGILGSDPFGTFLDELVRGEKAGGRDIIVKRFNTVDDITAAHVLFVSRSHESHSSRIFALANLRNILTISEAEEFTSKGGMVKFFTENNKVRFEVNLKAAKDAGIVFSSKVIRLADICCDKSGRQ